MINIDRLMGDLNAFAAIGSQPGGGVSRPAMSPAEKDARRYLLKLMAREGLRTWTDEAGNIFGRREADMATGETAALLVGSHIDSVENGGRYDGILGVLSALECVRSLNESGLKTARPIEIVAFNDEEERFLGFLGSYALVGEITREDVEGVTDHQGNSLVDTMKSLGLSPEKIDQARRTDGTVRAFLELHIEQGPVLDGEHIPVGIVTSVKGDYRWGIRVQGRTDHAGAPLSGRKDAFMAMHSLVGHMIEYRDRWGNSDDTLTVGRIVVEPNIETAQPGRVEISVDLRSPRTELLVTVEKELRRVVGAFNAEEGLTVEMWPILTEEPVQFDRHILETITAAVEDLGYDFREMYSGAGHDAQVMARHIPTAMIFVPSVGGRSHCPEEFTAVWDIEKGANVLYGTMVRLATE